jgi:hypothetical protein
MKHLFLLLVVFSVLQSVHLAASITCYDCLSSINSQCNEPDNHLNVPTCQGLQCSSILSTKTGVIRTCLPEVIFNNGCKKSTVFGVDIKTCHCTTKYCNNDLSDISASSTYNTSQIFPNLLLAVFILLITN